MLKINCLIQDTSLQDDIKQLMQYYAATKIKDGNKADFIGVYNSLRGDKVEVDIETAAALYQDLFDLTDKNYSSVKELAYHAGKIFADNLDNMQLKAARTYRMTGQRSPAQAVADALTHLFKIDNSTSKTISSPMLQMQNALKKAAIANLQRTAKPAQAHESLDQLLTRVLDQADAHIDRLTGGMNTMSDLVRDFKSEMDAYTNGLPISEKDTWKNYINDAEKALYNTFLSNREADSIIKQSLFEAGFGKTDSNGKVNIDWAKLAGGIKSISDLKRNVMAVLVDKVGQTNADRIGSSLVARYDTLLSRSLAHNTKVLKQGNDPRKPTVPPSELKRLMKYYNYGLFDAGNSGLYDNLMSKIVGFTSQDKKVLAELQQSMADIDAAWKVFGDSDRFLTIANDSISNIIMKYGGHEGTFGQKLAFKVARTLWNWVSDLNKTILYNLHNILQNYIGNQITLLNRKFIGDFRSTEIPGSISTINSVASAYFKEVGRGASMYGGGSHHFLQPGGVVESNLEKWGMNKTLVGILTGRYVLDGFDSHTKYLLTQQNIIYNTRKVLMEKHGKTRQEANRIITEELFGVKFEDAKKQARDLIKKSNGLMEDNENNVLIVADDLIKTNLITSGALTNNEWSAIKKASFTAAGLQIGHEALDTTMGKIFGLSGEISRASGKYFRERIEESIKNKKTGLAATYIMTDLFLNKIGLKFVGGASNWIVIAAKRTGLGMTARMSGSYDTDLKDVPDDELQKKMYDHLRVKNDFITGAMGAIATVGFFLATAAPLGKDDEPIVNIYDWVNREENKWAKKYIDVIAPVTFMMWLEFKKGGGFDDPSNGFQNLWDKQLKRMFTRDNGTGFYADLLQSDRKYDFNKGALEDFDKKRWVKAFANEFLEAPVGIWRVVRDIYKDVTIPVANTVFNAELERRGFQSFKLENWVEAAFWNGIIWELGVQDELISYMRNQGLVTDDLDVMKGVGPSDIEHFRKKGISNPDQLRARVRRNHPYVIKEKGKIRL